MADTFKEQAGLVRFFITFSDDEVPGPVDESYGQVRRLLYAFFSSVLLSYRGDIECLGV